MPSRESRNGWRVYLGATMTGALGPELPVEWSSSSVKMVLNDHDQVKVVTRTEALRGVPARFWAVRAGCLVVTYTDASGVERIVSASPISRPPKQDRRSGAVSFEGAGASWIFEKRIVTNEDYQPDDFKGLRKSTVATTGKSFRAIVAMILRLAGEKRRLGYMPLVLPDESEKGIHQRTYEGFNVANNGAWKRIEEITKVIGGPDVQFRPRWANAEHTLFEWEVLVGSDEQQTLDQGTRQIQWDATTEGSEVSSIEVTSSADDLAHRVYATGAGEGSEIALSMAEMKEIPDYMPLAEVAISDSDAEVTEVETGASKLLTEKAKGALVNNALDQLTLTVHSDPVNAPIGTWWCGELARVRTSGWLSVPDGEHKLRIIQTEYSLGSDMVKVDCQEDYLGEDLTW